MWGFCFLDFVGVWRLGYIRGYRVSDIGVMVFVVVLFFFISEGG